MTPLVKLAETITGEIYADIDKGGMGLDEDEDRKETQTITRSEEVIVRGPLHFSQGLPSFFTLSLPWCILGPSNSPTIAQHAPTNSTEQRGTRQLPRYVVFPTSNTVFLTDVLAILHFQPGPLGLPHMAAYGGNFTVFLDL
jgi:hypothetical protein